MKKCRVCNKELPSNWRTDICLDCSRKNMKKLFRENPEVKQAFKESIEELRRPENIEKMARNTVRFIQEVQSVQKRNKD